MTLVLALVTSFDIVPLLHRWITLLITLVTSFNVVLVYIKVLVDELDSSNAWMAQEEIEPALPLKCHRIL